MEKFDRGAKRKCTKCSTLFFDFGKHPIVCPACGADVNSLLTNVSKRGRPPKTNKSEETEKKNEMKIDQIGVEEEVEENVEDVDSEESTVEDIVEIERDDES